MPEPARVELTLLGQTLTLRSAASPEYLRSLAAFLEERVAAIRKGGVRDSETALVRSGGMTPRDLARVVGLSEEATVSIVSRLAVEGRVRITGIELMRAARASAA